MSERKRRGPVMLLLVDLYYWVKKLLCVIRRRHTGPVIEIGHIAKAGARAMPMMQCRFCLDIWAKSTALERRFGAWKP
jgi:hypothetical protein